MELRHLRYFRVVAEELHFRRAAARLQMAQPPLSAQIKQLEEELGVELFTRTTRQVELTAAGAVYLERVREILDAVDAAGDQAQRVADGTIGSLSIGCVGSATYSIFPQLIRTLRDELPDVDFHIRGEMLVPAQLAALESGTIDLALLRPPITAPRVIVEPVRRDRLIALVPDTHPVARLHSVDVGALRRDDFIVHAGHGRSMLNGVIMEMCADAGFSPHVRHEVAETSTLVTMVASGLGVAIVPEPTAALGIPGAAYVPLLPETSIELAAAWIASPASALVERAVAVLRRL
ncbi:LysR substrate-binding domain-containing protein [Gordonia hydrophobica]|uniref:LysR substrate-binding domain-containing protein n=1 Tax=Gordonia hydrophobica TaxID=40516 RepID=A0ABZ2U5B2_9ACTN|nr:LysR substrate-binding domain-containing protein [Gordonia hydrophobica]MBM7368296.1 DNA-binding transcriptional LysR family regulator [Gordonia hydrophobica]